MTEYRESNIVFEFPDEYSVVKFDDSRFYRNMFNCLPGGKGVDFIVDSKERIILLEVKNCIGYEKENRKRTCTVKDGRTADGPDIEKDATFDVEVANKVAMTLACLVGAYAKGESAESAIELTPYFKAFASKEVHTQKKDILVILVLEGKFPSKARDKKMIMGQIQKSIRSKLCWLTTGKILVVDHETYKQQYFGMQMETA